MDNAEFQILMNEIEKLNGRLDDVVEHLNLIDSAHALIIGYIKQSEHNTKSKAQSIFEAAPDDEYLDKLEVEELKQAKEEIQRAISDADNIKNETLSKYNCTYPNHFEEHTSTCNDELMTIRK